MESSVLQKGEKVLLIRLDQKKEGIELYAQAHPMVESFFKEMSVKEQEVSGQGNGLWYNPTGGSLRLYSLSGQRGSFTNPNYTFEYPGYSLTAEEVGLNHTCVNLSFLRIKGITDGITLGIKTVMSLSGRREYRDMVHMGMKRFVRDFLVPVTLELEIRVEDRLHV